MVCCILTSCVSITGWEIKYFLLITYCLRLLLSSSPSFLPFLLLCLFFIQSISVSGSCLTTVLRLWNKNMTMTPLDDKKWSLDVIPLFLCFLIFLGWYRLYFIICDIFLATPPEFILDFRGVSRHVMGMQPFLIGTDKWRVAMLCAFTAVLMDGWWGRKGTEFR